VVRKFLVSMKLSLDEFLYKLEEREALESEKKQRPSKYSVLMGEIANLQSAAKAQFSELNKLLWDENLFPEDPNVRSVILANRQKALVAFSSLLEDVLTPLLPKIQACTLRLGKFLSCKYKQRNVRGTAEEPPIFLVARGFGKTVDQVLELLEQEAQSVKPRKTKPLTLAEVAELVCGLDLNSCMSLKEAAKLVVGSRIEHWGKTDWRRLIGQIRIHTSSIYVYKSHHKYDGVVITHGSQRGDQITTEFWCGLLSIEHQQMKRDAPKKPKLASCSKKTGRKPTYEKFPAMIPLIEAYIRPYAQMADNRRRKKTVELDCTKGTGFTLPGLLLHLYKQIPKLYESGFDVRALHHVFAPPVASTRAAKKYTGIVDARRGTRRNNWREITEGTHFARAERKLVDEFFQSHGQLRLSGDDMNIIQVGRQAVSRYHQVKGFFPTGAGPNYEVHDFPNAEYGIKLGGFMVQGVRIWQKKRQKFSLGTEDNLSIRRC
jgi:hypothetical protein